jgi:hypothetical protein
MIIKRRFPNFIDIGHPDEWPIYEVNSREDIEKIDWVNSVWAQHDEFNLAWSHNPGFISSTKYPTMIMAEGLWEDGDKKAYAIFLCEGNAADLGLKQWDYKNK